MHFRNFDVEIQNLFKAVSAEARKQPQATLNLIAESRKEKGWKTHVSPLLLKVPVQSTGASRSFLENHSCVYYCSEDVQGSAIF